MITQNLTPVNNKGQRHGYWECYWNNGNLYYKGNYLNGMVSGYWEQYSRNGRLTYKEFYIL